MHYGLSLNFYCSIQSDYSNVVLTKDHAVREICENQEQKQFRTLLKFTLDPSLSKWSVPRTWLSWFGSHFYLDQANLSYFGLPYFTLLFSTVWIGFKWLTPTEDRQCLAMKWIRLLLSCLILGPGSTLPSPSGFSVINKSSEITLPFKMANLSY